MRIVLIAPPIMDFVSGELRPIAQDATHNCPPYGLYLLAAILRNRHHDVAMVDLIAAGTNRIDRWLELFLHADLVGITATSLSWPTALDVVVQVRALNGQVPIVAGGVHATIFDTYIVERFPVDYVLRGEAEVSLPVLCAAIEGKRGIETVPNLTWKRDGKVIRNKLGPLLSPAEIATAPVPAFDLLPEGIYKSLPIESSRGCAFDCSFCSTSYRQVWRPIPADLFVNRLEQFLPYLPKTTSGMIQIVDDEFSINPRRVVQIVRLLVQRRIDIRFVFDVRAPDLLDAEFLEAVVPYANQFLLGAECGYDEGLEKIGKRITCAQLEAAAKALHQAGIAELANFSFILGLPWEGRREIEKTIDFASRLYGEYGVKLLLQRYCLIPGSQLWQEERDKLVVTEAMYDEYGFFRNFHFWFSSERVSPAEAWEVEDLLRGLRWLSHLVDPDKQMIQHTLPHLLGQYFPRNILKSNGYGIGLHSLREVAHP